MKVTDEDLVLINALQVSPRAPWSKLGHILQRHPSALAARWQRLTDAGVAWVMAYPKQVGGRGTTALIALTATPGRRQELLDWLLRLPNIASVEDAGGSYDLTLTVLAADYAHLATEVLAPLRASQLVAHLNTSLVTAERATGGVWRLDFLTPSQERELTRLTPTPVHRRKEDPAGFPALLKALGADGRAEVNHLAEVMGVHPSTAGRRLRQALDEDAISFRCDMAQYDSGYPVLCQWFARVPPKDHERVHTFLRRYRTLRLLLSVTGEANLIFTVWLRHPGEILQVELDLLAAVPTVRLIRTDSGLAVYKRMGRLLGPDSRTTGTVQG